jgi:hypothetical protein
MPSDESPTEGSKPFKLVLTNTSCDENLKNETKDNMKELKGARMLDTLVCKYCLNEDMREPCFLPESAEDLYLSFHLIPSHILNCPMCPEDVKIKLQTLKAFRPIQEAFLERGSQKKLTENVWNKLGQCFSVPENLEDSQNEKKQNDLESNSQHLVATTNLLSDKDRCLVSEYTFYTMEQMEPCVLENSGNGSRSMFAFGFPGLGCKHCAGQPNARKFFYRTPEILSGNYAHIPNHIFSCKYVPSEVKQILSMKKKLHQTQKQQLHRGSQRIFFNNIFDRLHLKINNTNIS